jgi:hypothetical protein
MMSVCLVLRPVGATVRQGPVTMETTAQPHCKSHSAYTTHHNNVLLDGKGFTKITSVTLTLCAQRKIKFG